MEFDLNKWIDETFDGIPETEKAVITKAVSQAAVGEKLKASVMRHSDYSRQADELRAQRQQLETDQQKATKAYEARFAALSDSEGKTKAQLKKLQDDLAAAEADLAAADEALEKAREAGFELEDEGERKPPKRPRREETPPADQPKYVTMEDLQKALADDRRKIGKAYGPWPLLVNKINNLHGKLFEDQEPDWDKLWAAYEAKPEVPIENHWSQMYDVPKRAAEMDKAERDKELEKAREEGRQKAIEEMTRIPDSPQPEHFVSPALRLSANIQQKRAEEGKPHQRGTSPVERAARRTLQVREQIRKQRAAPTAA